VLCIEWCPPGCPSCQCEDLDPFLCTSGTLAGSGLGLFSGGVSSGTWTCEPLGKVDGMGTVVPVVIVKGVVDTGSSSVNMSVVRG
jgi:hypothetical protein